MVVSLQKCCLHPREHLVVTRAIIERLWLEEYVEFRLLSGISVVIYAIPLTVCDLVPD